MFIPWGNKGERDNARNKARCTQARKTTQEPGWTTSTLRQDSRWKSQSEWQRTGINGESTSMVWPTLRLRTVKEQKNIVNNMWSCRWQTGTSVAVFTDKALYNSTYMVWLITWTSSCFTSGNGSTIIPFGWGKPPAQINNYQKWKYLPLRRDSLQLCIYIDF